MGEEPSKEGRWGNGFEGPRFGGLPPLSHDDSRRPQLRTPLASATPPRSARGQLPTVARNRGYGDCAQKA
jgi:hypothetical protein